MTKSKPKPKVQPTAAAPRETVTLEFPSHAMQIGRGHVAFAEAAPDAAAGDGASVQTAERSFAMSPALAGFVPGHWMWGDLHIELSGISMPRQVPALFEHSADRRVGFTTELSIVDGVGLVARGTMLENALADEIRRDAASGYPWEASVRLHASSIEEVAAGVKSSVNGAEVVGPVTIFRQSRLREVSFAAIGYDPETQVQAFSAGGATVAVPVIRTTQGQPMSNPIPAAAAALSHQAAAELADPVSAERARAAAILAAVIPAQGALAQKLIADGVELSDALSQINVDLRARMQSAQPAAASAAVAAFESGDASLASGSGTTDDAALLSGMPAGADPEVWLAWRKAATKDREAFSEDFQLFAAYGRAQRQGRIVQLDAARAERSIISV